MKSSLRRKAFKVCSWQTWSILDNVHLRQRPSQTTSILDNYLRKSWRKFWTMFDKGGGGRKIFLSKITQFQNGNFENPIRNKRNIGQPQPNSSSNSTQLNLSWAKVASKTADFHHLLLLLPPWKSNLDITQEAEIWHAVSTHKNKIIQVVSG